MTNFPTFRALALALGLLLGSAFVCDIIVYMKHAPTMIVDKQLQFQIYKHGYLCGKLATLRGVDSWKEDSIAITKIIEMR